MEAKSMGNSFQICDLKVVERQQKDPEKDERYISIFRKWEQLMPYLNSNTIYQEKGNNLYSKVPEKMAGYEIQNSCGEIILKQKRILSEL